MATTKMAATFLAKLTLDTTDFDAALADANERLDALQARAVQAGAPGVLDADVIAEVGVVLAAGAAAASPKAISRRALLGLWNR